MTIRTLAFLALATACLDTTTTSSAIVGGVLDTDRFSEVGFLLLETANGSPAGSCTATLIAPDAAVTAAHCLLPVGVTVTTAKLVRRAHLDGLADIPLVIGSTLGHVGTSLFPHPEYTGADDTYFDVAVVLFGEPRLGAPIARIVSPEDRDRFMGGRTLTSVGYGLSYNAVRSETLAPYGRARDRRSIELPIRNAFPYTINSSTLQDGSTCFGDSGGPAFVEVDGPAGSERRIAGVSSTVNAMQGCVGGSTFTRLDVMIPFIANIMSRACEDGTRSAEACDAQRLPLGVDAVPRTPDPAGEPLPSLDAPPIDVGDGPSGEGGCRCLAGHAGAWFLPVAALLLVIRRRPMV